ncbi:hypothetical protein [Bradyrhizobium sp. BWA-3-5]|uniref:hypothetical protein n=1 Tax=Bradyrhizobium sp. BWA-3-5 TaxID=3080013 RepID=UPI00293E6F77|nr:hypothetical protein [Bradyrhizobium sp. BWA-3-5]WOH64333.1 hypothetical protein RX331_27815 [Bradyrhizobium sp. BWA-3-5]
MTRLPQHPVGLGTSSQGLDVGEHSPVIGPNTPKAKNMGPRGVHADGATKQASWRDEPAQNLPIDPAREAALEVNSIDAVSRVTRFERGDGANEFDPRAVLAALYGHNLSHGLLSFVIPRLRHPDVLRADRHCALLERLTQTLEATPDDNTACECLAILQQELRRLLLLRHNQNSLIKG